MKKRVITGLVALLSVALISVLAVAIPAVSSAKSLVNALKSGDQKIALDKSSSLASNLDRTFAFASLPGIKQSLGLFNLDFSPIRDEVTSFLQAAPYVAGVSKPQRYLISFQNSAEARGTGGILGAFAIVEFDKGNIKVIRTGSNAAMASLKEIPVPVTEEFMRLYGKNPAILQNSNLSPHLPYGAEIWMGLWKRQTGEDLDGVIAVDPTALSYVLKATGPVTVAGREIGADNVVSETLKDAYKRYEKDNNARKQYLVDIMNATAAKLTAGDYSKLTMLKAIRDGIKERRLLFYTTNKSAENLIAPTKIASYMTTSPNNEYRVVIQNIDASKLDYYLARNVEVKQTACGALPKSTVTVRVTNTLQSGHGLPAYVLTRADKGKPDALVTGQHRFKVFIYGPVGSTIVSAWREDLKQGIGGQSTERKRPVMVMDVDLAPTKSEMLQVNFTGGTGKTTFVDQPLVIPTDVSIKGACS